MIKQLVDSSSVYTFQATGSTTAGWRADVTSTFSLLGHQFSGTDAEFSSEDCWRGDGCEQIYGTALPIIPVDELPLILEEAKPVAGVLKQIATGTAKGQNI
jgi:hypothetical protein